MQAIMTKSPFGFGENRGKLNIRFARDPISEKSEPYKFNFFFITYSFSATKQSIKKINKKRERYYGLIGGFERMRSNDIALDTLQAETQRIVSDTSDFMSYRLRSFHFLRLEFADLGDKQSN